MGVIIALVCLLITNAIMTNNGGNSNETKRKFEYIYSAYSGRIYNFVLRISHGNKYLAEEITQIVFLKLWEKRNVLNDEAAMLSYMFSIAKNTFLNCCEHEVIEHVYYNYIMRYSSDSDYSTMNQLNQNFLNDFLVKLSDNLPPQRKKVFRMSKLEGKTNKAIAEELNISSNTVERHMSLALEEIKEQMRKHYNVWAPAFILLTSNF